jgi:DNA adenine methylase
LVPDILQRLPSEIETYYEPFAGSAAVFFALGSEGRFKRAVLSDQNRELIDVYKAIKRDVASVIAALKEHPYDREVFYRVRATDPRSLDLAERAARFIYLNKTGFNGLYRVNRSGAFNVPFGRYTNPKICDEPRLRRCAEALKGARLLVSDFEHACQEAKGGDAVYFDPPYVPISKTSNFTAYHSVAFEDAEHQRLAETFAALIDRGVRVVLSNSDTPATRKLYKAFKPTRILVARPINSKSHMRGDVGEILVSG